MSFPILLLLGVGMTASDGGSEKSATDKLLGAWTVLSVERDGKPLGPPKQNEEGPFDPFFALKGDQIVFLKADPRVRTGIGVEVKSKRGDLDGGCWLDPETTPKAMTLSLQPAGKNWRRVPTFKGIYALEEGRLKICLSERPGGKPPTAFTTKEGSDYVLILLERAKP